MTNQRRVLILTFGDTGHLRQKITRFAEILDCKTPFEVTSFWEWKQRWGVYDWDSPAFERAILNRYCKICVYGSAGKEEREMLERIRPFYAKSYSRQQEPTREA